MSAIPVSTIPMPRYAAFLRAINVGKRRVKMDKLQSIFSDAGFTNVSTLIASGNVRFDSPLKSTSKLRTQIEQLLFDSLGYQVDTFLRTDSQLKSIVNGNPFELDQSKDPMVNVHVFFFHERLAQDLVDIFRRHQSASDQLETIGCEAYWRCHGKLTDSVFWEQPEIKKLKLPTNTSRKIDTVRRMLDAT